MTDPKETGTNTAEMLELIGKVTASLSDRMDAQGKALEDIGQRVHAGNDIIRDRMPTTPARIEALKHDLKGVHETLIQAQDSLSDAEHRAKDAWQRVETKTVELRDLRDDRDTARAALRTWKRATLFAAPVIVLMLALILPTLLARHPLGCKAILGTWHVEDGKAYCFFRRTAPGQPELSFGRSAILQRAPTILSESDLATDADDLTRNPKLKTGYPQDALC